MLFIKDPVEKAGPRSKVGIFRRQKAAWLSFPLAGKGTSEQQHII